MFSAIAALVLSPSNSSSSRSSYDQEHADFRLRYSKAGALLSTILVMAGCGLDFFTYPERSWYFMSLRVAVSLLTLGIFFLLSRPPGEKYVRQLTLLWLLLPQVMIAFMIYETDGARSIYFVGLNLALYAGGIILPISFFEAIAFGVLTAGLYLAACVSHVDFLNDLSLAATNTIFIVFSAAISALCTFFNESARTKLFKLQQELSLKNSDLLSTNTALAEVKGQLIQREKMAAIGTLSAGLLHEINNPVNYSLMAVEMGRSCPEVSGSTVLKESLDDAREGLKRIQSIVGDLKTFAYQRLDAPEKRAFDLKNSLNSALRLVGFDLKGLDVQVVTAPDVFDTRVLGDEPAVIGVFINLLTNAAQAVKHLNIQDAKISIALSVKNDRLCVSVRDNGEGISQENINRVFEPFFTTRDVGAGLGLGLSVSYGVVQRHGGILTVESTPGDGAEFKFDLPQPT